MYHYRFLGFHIESDIEFPYMLKADENTESDILFVEGEVPERIYEMEKNQEYYDYGKEKSYFVNYTVRMFLEEGRKITYSMKLDKEENINPLRAYLIGFGMSTLALQRDLIAIHCSVVVNDGKAYLICGESGAGKSTLTKQFLEKGYHFMVDDMTIVDPLSDEKYAYARPAFPYQKLCRDAAVKAGLNLEDLIYINEQKDKFLAPCGVPFETENMPIGGMIYLYPTKEDHVVYRVAEGMDKFYLCSNNLFLRHILREDKYKPQIGQKCLKMASKLPICTIGRPAEKDTVQEMFRYAVNFVEQERNS